MKTDGELLAGGSYLALPERSNGAGVLALHAWWGLTPFHKSVCDRLAQAGYVVLAPDLHQGALATTIEEAKTLLNRLDWANAGQHLHQAAETLRARPEVTQPEIGLLGFSLGGHFAQGLAAQPDSGVAAAVVFYDLLGGDYRQTRSAFQYHLAETDPYIDDPNDAEAIQKQLAAAGRVAEFYTYPGTGHWFFESDREDAYEPQSAALAWERTLRFLDEQLQQATG